MQGTQNTVLSKISVLRFSNVLTLLFTHVSSKLARWKFSDMDNLHIVMKLVKYYSRDKELDAVLCQIGAQLVHSNLNCISGYTEVVAKYFDYEFKCLFHLDRDTFETLVEHFKPPSFFSKAVGSMLSNISGENVPHCFEFYGYAEQCVKNRRYL